MIVASASSIEPALAPLNVRVNVSAASISESVKTGRFIVAVVKPARIVTVPVEAVKSLDEVAVSDPPAVKA